MVAIDYALALIKRWEGCELVAYLDVGGVWTIGWGATGAGIGAGVVWSQRQADARLGDDLHRFSVGVDKLVKVRLQPWERGALYSFAYNVGLGALGRSSLLRLVNSGDFNNAAKQFDRWNKVGAKVVQGLVRRRADERRTFEGSKR